jgi:5,10-methylenetetrahydromethanopterin reductase
VVAAFYLSSMAPEHVERHGMTTPEIGERLSIAGEPAEWIERLRSDFTAHGYNHVALGLVDPSLVESWSGRRIDGVPDFAGQLELFADQVAPALTPA